ncbi:hypothetical protein QAD02_010501 [Eretmocerus hayati]|uniref:Uncharacterized protein n=1 Tax=Eretmocerus hayati TaxID=131215 RepID=A0ACC2NYN7_9HYME|nr:hypothetical protein QAD02_010501 [Eretmocerus hayati]
MENKQKSVFFRGARHKRTRFCISSTPGNGNGNSATSATTTANSHPDLAAPTLPRSEDVHANLLTVADHTRCRGSGTSSPESVPERNLVDNREVSRTPTIDVLAPVRAPEMKTVKSQSVPIRVMQLNCRRCQHVMGELHPLVAKRRVDLLILQEPHAKSPEGESPGSWTIRMGGLVIAIDSSERPWAAVSSCNRNLSLLEITKLSSSNCCVVEVNDWDVRSPLP